MENHVKLWSPSDSRKENSQIKRFMKFISKKFHIHLDTYEELHSWSIMNIEDFWSSLSEYYELNGIKTKNVLDGNLGDFFDIDWFPDSKINYAESLLRFKNSETIALTSIDSSSNIVNFTFKELLCEARNLQGYLLENGLKKGDHVSAILPNEHHAVIAMLAVTSIGAVWSACDPEFGSSAILNRLSQVKPKFLFVSSNDFDKFKTIFEELGCITKYILTGFKKANSKKIESWGNWADNKEEMKFEMVSFNHPLFILFSSGTTGLPKCLVHSHGGTLLQHVKELGLHTGLSEGDSLLFYTSTGWMMWNWMVSALALGIRVFTFSGNPMFPKPDRLFQLAEEYSITALGLSPKILLVLQRSRLFINKIYELESLKTILSTGSILSPKLYEYVYKNVKKDVMLSSISGGSDILGCFMLGCEILPVYSGLLQCPGLGMDVTTMDNSGNSILEESGELVCRKPFPSMPIYFIHDINNEKYKKAYFSKFDKVWAHGDLVTRFKNNSFLVHGRSDSVLNTNGVKAGTGELYSLLDNLTEIKESLAIDDSSDKLILFVILNDGLSLNTQLELKIRKLISTRFSKYHIPSFIHQVFELPRTYSGKVSETAVKSIFKDEKITNISSIANVEALEIFKSIYNSMSQEVVS